jgi:hypothetical protein
MPPIPSNPWTRRANLPEDLIYLSKRITTDLVQRDRSNPGDIVGGGLSGFGFGFQTPEPADVDWNNPYGLASRATLAVKTQTTTLSKRRSQIPKNGGHLPAH